ncbi:Swt1 family HEPN domain-containing protein [Yaniella halotolerans]|uniref:Swt1 family HEPN domain-containing protein n=1 Tax=Yaniella halotolerans TaxID=225453 RepID=UPI0003B58740|nr:Swt1 family HEPN domain-containing protein [Yaniella halotolerans]
MNNERILSRQWVDKALHTLAPALDTYISHVMADILGPELAWTEVLSQLDRLKGKPPRTLNRRDPALQFRMLTERLGELGHPFDRHNRSRLFSTYGQMLRLHRNQLAHGDDSVEPTHAMHTVFSAVQLARLIDAPETVEALETIHEDILEYLWKDQNDHTPEAAITATPAVSVDTPNPEKPQNHAVETTVADVPKLHSLPKEQVSLSKRIISWDPIAIHPIGDREDLETLRRQSSKRKVIQAIETLVDDYGPISEAVLVASVGRAFGVKRLSKKISQKFVHQLKNADVVRDQDGFYWSPGINPAQWSLFRTDPSGQRQVQEISPYELANLVEVLVAAEPSRFDKTRLLNALGSHFGLQRIIGPTRRHLALAIKRSITNGQVHRKATGKFTVSTNGPAQSDTKKRTTS